MNKFVVFSFLMLGLGFYEMSGGADFVPETRPAKQIAIIAKTAYVPSDAPQVTRAAAMDLPNFTATPEVEVTPTSLDIIAIAERVIAADLREVTGKRVNMRAGPSTDYDVLDTLTFGTQAEVIEVTADGWARVRVIDTNQIGWMAERLLSDG